MSLQAISETRIDRKNHALSIPFFEITSLVALGFFIIIVVKEIRGINRKIDNFNQC